MTGKFPSVMTTSSLVFNQLLLEKTPVTLILDRGEKLSGQLTGWDEHYLVLLNESKLQVVPSWRLLWLESDLSQNPGMIVPNDAPAHQDAVLLNPVITQPKPEILESVPKEVAATSIESPDAAKTEIAQDLAVSDQTADAQPQQAVDNKLPLDHLEQLIKNW